MIGNLLNFLIGVWLAYSSIFANPAGAMNSAALAVSADVAIAFSVWARQTDAMGWQSATNIVLGLVLLLLAAMRRVDEAGWLSFAIARSSSAGGREQGEGVDEPGHPPHLPVAARRVPPSPPLRAERGRCRG